MHFLNKVLIILVVIVVILPTEKKHIVFHVKKHILKGSALSFASLLGGSEYMDVLHSMRKGHPELSGATYFSDPRLVANGFQIRVSPGKPLI